MSDTTAVSTVETMEEAAPDNASLVRVWLEALAIADKDEENWRNTAVKTVEIFRAQTSKEQGHEYREENRKFNIFHSNVQTLLPALYNSTPIPDVRRRFADDDPLAKAVSDLIERGLSYSVDSYDFDATLRRSIFDMEVVGRGVTRVRFMPYTSGDEVVHQEVQCEHVVWKHFRRGPGYTWDDVPWIAFELFLTRDQLMELSPEMGNKVNLDVVADHVEKRDGRNIPEILKRARVWEIWDRQTRKVIFIATGYKEGPIRVEDDPLKLQGFWPIPRPLYAIGVSDGLVPVIPYELYRAQAEELEEVSRRILTLTEAVKAKAIYDGRMTEVDRLADEEDAAMVPITNIAVFADGSKLSDHIMFYPIEVITQALEKLYIARDQIKQVIYEITGIADILRGESDANETLGAQQIKQQWGSLRIQQKQAEVQRFARDLFRLKAEIMASHFAWETIAMMTGIDFPGQQDLQQAQMMAQQAQASGQPLPPQLQEMLSKPPREMVEQLLRTDSMRGFRIDVESDSTIRADMTRNQQNMNMFLQGTAQFAAAMGPIIMGFPALGPAVFEVYTAFARNFKLGKQAEDALDGVADKAKEMAANPPPKPEEQAEAKKAEIEEKRLQMDQQANEQKLQFEQQKHEQEMVFKQQEFEASMQMKSQEMAMSAQADGEDRQMRHEYDMAKLKSAEKPPVQFRMDADDSMSGAIAQSLEQNNGAVAEAVQLLADVAKQMAESNERVVQALTAPKRVIRDQNGRLVGAEVVSSRTLN